MKSYIRFLTRNKLYTAIMVVGLSVAFAFIIPTINHLIHFSRSRHLYSDYEKTWTLTTLGFIGSSPAIGEVLKEGIPQIEKVSTADMSGQKYLVDGNEVSVFRCDKEFFDFFPIKFIRGDKGFIETPSQICVSKKFADNLMTDGKPVIGRDILLGDQSYMIAAVMENLGDGAIKYCDILMNIEDIKDSRSFNQYTVTVFSASDTIGISDQIEKICTDFYGMKDERGKKMYDKLVRYDDFCSYPSQFAFSSSTLSARGVLSAITLILLLISIINYCNLAVPVSNLRAKEFATRNLLGARPGNTYWVLFLEAMLFGICCMIFAIPLSYITSEHISDFMILMNSSPGNLDFNPSPEYLVFYFMIVVLVASITAVPSASVISKFSPLNVTKGDFRYFSKKTLSKIFMSLQMVIIIFVVCLSITMYREYILMITEDTHCEIEDVLYLCPQNKDTFPYEMFLSELEKQPEVISCGLTHGVPNQGRFKGNLIEKQYIYFEYVLCDDSAFATYGFNVIEGSIKDPKGIWMTPKTETMVEAYPELMDHICATLNMENIVGKVETFTTLAGNYEHSKPVVGVADRTVMLESQPDIVIKTIPDHKVARDKTAEIYAKATGEIVTDSKNFGNFSGYLIEDIMEYYYGENRKFAYSIGCFGIIAIIMVIIGLYGICVYFTSEQQKSTAIRKIFGSDIRKEVSRLIRLYIRLTVIANIIALPCYYLYAQLSFTNISRRPVEIILICLFSMALSFLICYISVLLPASASARTNPAEVLKKE